MQQRDQTLSVFEVARELNLHKESVRRNIRRGRLHTAKISNKYSISRDDLDMFVAHCRRSSETVTSELLIAGFTVVRVRDRFRLRTTLRMR